MVGRESRLSHVTIHLASRPPPRSRRGRQTDGCRRVLVASSIRPRCDHALRSSRDIQPTDAPGDEADGSFGNEVVVIERVAAAGSFEIALARNT